MPDAVRTFRTGADGIQEVSGSIPLISTTKSSENLGFQNFFFVFSKKKFSFIAPRFRGAKLFDPEMTQTWPK